MRFVKMASDERRKIIEEVAGISIYEMRKEKSLKELDKTEEKLRQVNAILRERTNYMKNLENKNKEIEKIEKVIKTAKISVAELQEKIDTITKTIQKSAGVEQDTLLEEISLLKQEFAGMIAQKEKIRNIRGI